MASLQSDPVQLSVVEHRRDVLGMTYVYPVVSRRAGGVSVGINLNPNNACNWRCIYCQVPDLIRGGAPPIDLLLLERELNEFLDALINGDYLQTHVPEGARQLVDLAFSGNGEPTTSAEFGDAVCIARAAMDRFGLRSKVLLRVITNGSQLDRHTVQQAIALLGAVPGEVWFKLDSATRSGLSHINSTQVAAESVLRRLKRCTRLAPTWVQTCMFEWEGRAPSVPEIDAYLTFIGKVKSEIAGVHLYGLARPSMQPEAPCLGRLDESVLSAIADRIREHGLTVCISP